MKYISFGKRNKSLLFIILMGIFMVINQYLYGFVYIECFYPINIYKSLYNAIIDKNKEDFPRHRIFDALFNYIGVMILSFFIPKEKKKKSIKNEEENDDEEMQHIESTLNIHLIHNETRSYLKKRKGFAICIVILVLWVVTENSLLIYVDIFQDLDFWFFELIIISMIFSRYFLFKIYSHQKLGMALSIGVGTILKIYNIIMSITTIDESKKNFYQRYPYLCSFILLYFLLIISRSFINTELKILMDLKFVYPRTLLMCYGLAGFIISSLIGLSFSLSPCPEYLYDDVCKIKYDDQMYFDNFLNYYESGVNMLVRLITIVIGMAAYFLNKYFRVLIIKNYTPIHVIFSFPLQFFIEKMFLLIFTGIFFPENLFSEDKQVEKFLLDIFGDVSSIIGFLIYLEMLELNFCGFNFNLKKNIINRGEDEYNITLDIDEQRDSDGRFSSVDSLVSVEM